MLSKFSSPSWEPSSEGKYVGYPLESIFGGKELGIDPYDGIYMYKLRPDAVVNEASDLKSLVNYRYYLGTSIAPSRAGLLYVSVIRICHAVLEVPILSGQRLTTRFLLP